MTSWTSPRTWVANVTAITASALNTDIRDNESYLKEVIAGTNSDKVPGPALSSALAIPGTATVTNNGNGHDFSVGPDTASRYSRMFTIDGLLYVTNNAYWDGAAWQRDSTSYPSWLMLLGSNTPSASVNSWTIQYAASASGAITWTTRLGLDTAGKLTGAGYYVSAEQTITSPNTVTVSHGLGAKPRFVSVFHASASGAESAATTPGHPAYDDAVANQVTIISVTTSQIQVRNRFGTTQYAYIYAML